MESASVLTAAARSRHTIGTRPMPGWLPGPYLLLLLTLLIAWGYVPPRWQDWNQNSRFDLTMALVERGTVRIDAYVANTGDYAVIDGRAYTDKAPGLSLLAVPVYATTTLLRPLGLGALSDRLAHSDAFGDTLTPGGEDASRARVDQAVALYIATLATVTIPAAVMLVLLALVVARVCGCQTAGILAALIVGLATPVYTYAQAFYGHIPAAACVTGALTLLVLRDDGPVSNRRLLLLGGLLGLAVVIEYPAALAGLPVALWAVALARGRAVVWGTLGAFLPLAVLATYDLVAFGTLLPVGYEHSALWQEQHDTGFLSLTYPRGDALWGASFGTFRGLFTLAPVLLLAVPGLVLALRDRHERAPVAVTGWSFALMFLFVGSSAMWWGGFAVGPRYLVPALPLLALPIGAFIARVNRHPARLRVAGLSALTLLAVVSAAGVWALTLARQGYPPDTIRSPLLDWALPALRDGDVARNLGMVLQLHGVASLLPQVLALGLAVALLGRALAAPVRVTE